MSATTTHGEWVFHDDRFPEMKIICRGRVTFNIYEHSPEGIPGYTDMGDGWYNTDVFTAHEDEQSYEVSWEFALQAATDHFDYMWAEARASADEPLVLGEDLGRESEAGRERPELMCGACTTTYRFDDRRFVAPVQDEVVRVACGCSEDLTLEFLAYMQKSAG